MHSLVALIIFLQCYLSVSNLPWDSQLIALQSIKSVLSWFFCSAGSKQNGMIAIWGNNIKDSQCQSTRYSRYSSVPTYIPGQEVQPSASQSIWGHLHSWIVLLWFELVLVELINQTKSKPQWQDPQFMAYCSLVTWKTSFCWFELVTLTVWVLIWKYLVSGGSLLILSWIMPLCCLHIVVGSSMILYLVFHLFLPSFVLSMHTKSH